MGVRHHTGAPRALAAALLLAATAACNPGSGGADLAGARGDANLSVSLKAGLAASIARVTVAISRGDGPDFQTMNVDLARAGSGWSAFVTGIPAGKGRRFDVLALDGSGTTLASGYGKADVVAGTRVSLTIVLTVSSPSTGNQAPVIDYLSASTDQVGPGKTVTVRVSASDPDPADTITYTWSSTCGAFDDAKATVAVWTAPAVPGACELTITVSDGKASVSASLDVTVKAAGRVISGMRLATHWPDPPASAVSAPGPDTLTSLPPQVLQADGAGGLTVLPGGHIGPDGAFVEGSFGSDGSFTVPGVAAGDYVLCHRPAGEVVTCLDGGADQVDLGFDVLGRTDQKPATQATPVTFSFTGLDAWNPLLERIEITSSGANLWDVAAPSTAVRSGEVKATIVEDWDAANGTRKALNLLVPADVLHVHQLSTRSFYTGFDIHFYVSATHALPGPAASGITVTDGQAASIPARLEPLALDGTLEVDWDPAVFEAHRPALGPPARTSLGPVPHRLTVAANAVGLEYPAPAASGSPELVVMTLPGSASRAAGSVWYGRFLPSHWKEWRGVSFSADVAYVAPGATTPWLERSEIETRTALPVAAGPFTPAVTPVGSPQIGGASALEDRVGVGESPTISWSAPSVGTPTGYLVEVSRLDVKDGATISTPVLRYATARLHVALPPGMLEAGATYFARITALVNSAPITAPFRGTNVFSRASTLTGTFTR